MQDNLFDIFQPGLKWGAKSMPRAPSKRYFYVEHPQEGWRVFIRNVAILHQEGAPFNPLQFLVVKDTGSKSNACAWEPPKGQMEGKDGLERSNKSLLDRMAIAVLREVEEEAKITDVKNLIYTGLVLQATENDYPANTYFQYHIFQGMIPAYAIKESVEKFAWFKKHPSAFKQLRKDNREKDDIEWFNPKKTRLYGRWSPSIVATYIQYYSKA